jgi:hypothetical protein
MTCRIDRLWTEQGPVLYISGRVAAEDLEVIRTALGGRRVVIELAEVGLVDRDAVMFLARIEAEGIELRGCPAYIRERLPRRALSSPAELGGTRVSQADPLQQAAQLSRWTALDRARSAMRNVIVGLAALPAIGATMIAAFGALWTGAPTLANEGRMPDLGGAITWLNTVSSSSPVDAMASTASASWR